jgi:hypothetical protein
MGDLFGGHGMPQLLPDPLGLFGERTDLIGRRMEQPQPAQSPAAAAEPPAPMPIADDEEVRKRRRRSIAQQSLRSGRASTIFSEGEGLGG